MHVAATSYQEYQNSNTFFFFRYQPYSSSTDSFLSRILAGRLFWVLVLEIDWGTASGIGPGISLIGLMNLLGDFSNLFPPLELPPLEPASSKMGGNMEDFRTGLECSFSFKPLISLSADRGGDRLS